MTQPPFSISRRRLLGAGLTLLLPAVPAFQGCAPARPASRDPRQLRVAIPGDERTLQPYSYETGYPGWNLLMLLYDSLFLLDERNQPQPWIALRDDASADGLTHRLTLRDDVRWHDGRRLTSDDVRFSFELYRTHVHGRWSAPARNLARIETPDAATVVMTLAAPDPSFAIRLLSDLPILPRHVWSSVTDPKRAEARIGSGPFRLAEYRPDSLYRLIANRDYFAGAPKVDELLLPVIKEPSTIFAALESGELDATTVELPPELLARFDGREEIAIARGTGYATTLLQFNCARAPWSDARVRRAVALAIDTRQLVDTVLLGQGTPGNPGWLHPELPAHDPAVTSERDLRQAAALLDAAGAGERAGDGLRAWRGARLAPTLLVQANVPARVRAAELIARAMREIGIDVRVRAEEATSVTAKVWPDLDVSNGRDFDWSMFGWAAPMMIDPVRMAALVESDTRYGTNNVGGFRNAEADALAARLRVAADARELQALARRLEAVIAHERPFAMLWYAHLAFASARGAYDGWRFQAGHGIFHKRSFLPSLPSSFSPSAESSGPPSVPRSVSLSLQRALPASPSAPVAP